ncbi:uncharacterized protein LOC133705642 [Populus nigra]|uniref:uncharacterized protein LOC133705642 n=1 Tax=Populus nigra TaxID=3691 RepID=UPI002B27272E|nr:uncharacterized protein LOC133705642 [Populus nigra]
MANLIDKDQEWLLNCLNATLDPNQEIRSLAEVSLRQASLQPGFGVALSKVAANKELPFGLRQLAAVLLKQFIKKHWHESEESFEPPAVAIEEKEVIRSLLLPSLDDSHRKMCTAISMAIASIAVYDWPENWPDLLPFLLKLINDRTNVSGVHGALRCLALLSGDLDDTVVPTLVPVLFPCLLTIVSSPQNYDNYLRMKALTIVYSCVSVLGIMSGVYKTEISALITPMLKPWMDQFSVILEPPMQPEDPDNWSLRMEVLKCLNQFVQNFPSLTESEFMVIVGPLWQTFVTSLSVYMRSSIECTEDPYGDRYDSDGAEKSLDAFVIQLFEFLLTVVGSAKLMKVVKNNIKELAYYTLAFLQMTEQQVHTWSRDANQFVADEDDATYSCRVSGVLLLEEVVNSFGSEGIYAIIDAMRERFNESEREKAAGSAAWWRIRESILFALADLSDQLLDAEASGMISVNLGNLVEQIVTIDVGTGVHEYPFLYARIFTSVAKFSSVISHGVLEHFLHAAVKGVGMNVPPPVKMGACQALSQLLPEANKENIQPQLMGLFSSLTDLLHQASDETLHLVLETLQASIKAVREAAVSFESVVSPVVLNTWALYVSDPFLSIDAIEVLEALKNAPGGIHPLVSRILPHIGPILNKPYQQPDGLVAGSLDLVTMLLKNAPSDVIKAIYDTCFDAVIRIVLQSDDHSEMQNATQCLASFISGGREEILSWAADSGFTMRSLLDAASRLLDPGMESSGSLFVGSYILQLILHLPLHMAMYIRDLVTALVRRMQSAQIVGLKSSLLLIFARLVHMSVPHVEQFIDMLIGIPAEGYENSFVYVMSEWTQKQGEIQGAYQIKVTTSALALLLSTRHAELNKVNVLGHLKSAAGITTRSKAKLAPDQWTLVPLPVKILALLADTVIEFQEQAMADDEESDWEEIQGGVAESNDSLLSSAAAPSFGRTTYGQLEAMAKAYNENEEDWDDDDLLSVSDQLNGINLVNYLADFFAKFVHSNRQLFDHLCQSLAQAQRDAIQTLLRC